MKYYYYNLYNYKSIIFMHNFIFVINVISKISITYHIILYVKINKKVDGTILFLNIGF